MNDLSLFSVKELALPGVLVLTPKVFADDRGFFVTNYRADVYTACGITTTFVQDVSSFSHKGIIRGMHFQRTPHIQDKLVHCAHGEIFDVVADCDPHSPTYGKHISVILKAEEQTMLFVPGKYAHGFCVLSDDAMVNYKMGDTYHPECAGGVLYNDPILGISWPIDNPILSMQDKSWKPLSQGS